jgi:CheY-like chemotaxis protein
MGAKRAASPSGKRVTITRGSDDALKVLVIDDQPLLRDVFAEFLELLGHESDLAADGCEGLARFDPLVHQVVVTDFLMPGLTGLEVAEAIRARGCRTPIVMISAFAGADDERRAVEAGLRFVRKPVTFAQFAAAMAEVVEHAGAGR